MSSARADVSFQYVTDATSYTTTAGSNVSVNVYLQETDTNGSSSILAAQGGLLSYGFYVAGGTTAGQSVINTSLNATASTNGAFTSASPFTQFGSNVNFNTSSYYAAGGSGLPTNALDYSNANNTFTTNGQVTANGYQVLLGTLNITAGTATTFTLTSMNNPNFLDPGNGGTSQSDNTYTLPISNPLDVDSDGSGYSGANDFTYTFTVGPAVSGVPEPGSMILCGLFASGMVGGYIRRRRLAKAEAA